LIGAKLSKNELEITAGVERTQMLLSSMKDAISQDNIMWFMDSFVDKLDLD
jgi:hypothetical protein